MKEGIACYPSLSFQDNRSRYCSAARRVRQPCDDPYLFFFSLSLSENRKRVGRVLPFLLPRAARRSYLNKKDVFPFFFPF